MYIIICNRVGVMVEILFLELTFNTLFYFLYNVKLSFQIYCYNLVEKSYKSSLKYNIFLKLSNNIKGLINIKQFFISH